jgi:translocation and assembly module TamB
MRRAVKRSLWSVGIACLGIAALGGALWVTVNTGAGRRLIEQVTYQLTGGTVRLIGLGGSFPERLTLEELQLRDRQGVWLTADRLSLRWYPLALLEGRIEADGLQLARLHIERAPVGGTPGGRVTIPHIVVGHFAVDAVELGAPLVGTAANFSASGSWQMRSLDDANGDLAARRRDGAGEYRLRLRLDPKRVDAWLAVHEPAGGPLENLLSLPGLGALTATATLAGPRSAVRADALVDAGTLHARVGGSIDITHATADLSYSLDAAAMAPRPDVAWGRVALKGNWRGPLTAPRADGTLDAEDLRLAAGIRALRLRAKLTANGGRLDVHSVIDGLQIPGPQPRLFAAAPLEVDGSVQLNQASRPLDISASHPLLALRLHADTAAEVRGGQRATVELRVPEVAPFAAFAAQDARGSATLTAQLALGRSEDTLTLDANLGFTGGTAAWVGIVGSRAALKLSGTLSDQTIKLQNLRLAGDALTLTASGSATRVPPGTAAAGLIKDLQGNWQFELADLGRLSSDVAGDLTMSGQLRGTPASMAAAATVASRLSVHGSAAGTVDARVQVLGLPNAPSVTLQAQGTLDGAPLNLDAALERSADQVFRVTVRHADWKSAHLAGDMTSNAELTQSRGQLQLHVGQLGDFDRLAGRSIAGSAEASLGVVSPHGRPEVQLELNGRDIVVGPLSGTVHLQAVGASEALGLQLNVQLPNLSGQPARLSAAATLNADARELRLASVSADYFGQNFRLLSPALLTFAKGLSVDDLKIGAQDAVFELSGELSPALDLHASLAHVDPGLINVFTPGLFASGTLEAQARLQGSTSSPTGSIRVDANAVRFADDAATGLPALDIHGRAQLADDTASLDATLTAGAGSQVTATGTAPLNSNGALNLKIGGKLDVGMVNPLLEARGLRAAGALTMDATVTGSSGAPRVEGGITLAEGSVRDYVRGVNLSNIQAQIVGGDAGLQIKSFSAKAGSGSVGMTGTFGVLQHGVPVDLKITARNAQPIASSIITANLDADLHVTGTALQRLAVAGTVQVDRATIGIPDSLPPDVAVLDVRRRGQSVPAGIGSRLVVGFDVAIEAPRQILVQGRGLDAELGGEIKLGGTSDDPQASGGFDLQRGSFTIAGNKLNLTPPGRVGFDGEGLTKKLDPTLDFTAQTTVNATNGVSTVTLQISGPADAPRFDFTSNPTLPQDEIMALLLFGEPASQLTALQVAEIGAALATLSGVGGGGSNPLVKLQKSLGLDRLNVGSNTTTSATGAPESSGAAIAAGRYVSRRVYVEAKQTTAGTSQLQVDVDLTQHLKLQTRLGNGTAAVQGTTPDNDPGSSVGIAYQFEY